MIALRYKYTTAKTSVNILAVLASLLFAILLSDYGLYLFSFRPLIIILVLATIFAALKSGLRVKKEIVLYGLATVCFCLINMVFHNNFNNVLFSPVLAYIFYKAFFTQPNNKDTLAIFFSLIVLLIIFLSGLEIMVKLGLIDNNILRELILNVGDKRIDVLRIKSPFGSPLSLAAVLFVLVIYFAVLNQNNFMLIAVLSLLILTGSRTSFILALALLGFQRLVPSLLSFNHIPRLLLFLSTVMGGVYIIVRLLRYWTGGAINIVLLRVLSLRSYLLLSDTSFRGRQYTTILTLNKIISNLPNTLLTGLGAEDYVSDSAIVSLMAGSGIIVTLVFLCYFFYRISKINIAYRVKLLLALLFLLEALMVGDSFVPFSSFCFFLMSFIFGKGNNEVKHAIRRG